MSTVRMEGDYSYMLSGGHDVSPRCGDKTCGFWQDMAEGLDATGFPACELVVERVPDAAGKTSEPFLFCFVFLSTSFVWIFFFFVFLKDWGGGGNLCRKLVVAIAV